MQYGAEKIIKSWPKDSHDTTEIVLNKYGEPDEQHQVFLFDITGVWMICVLLSRRNILWDSIHIGRVYSSNKIKELFSIIRLFLTVDKNIQSFAYNYKS